MCVAKASMHHHFVHATGEQGSTRTGQLHCWLQLLEVACD